MAGELFYQIELNKGKVALVDKEDYEYLNQWRWYCDARGYAVRSKTIDGKKRSIKMHRVILNTPEDMCTDHVNGNPLDNRKCNLRIANHSQNGMNRKINYNSGTGYKGVLLRKDTKKYRAYIRKDGKRRWIGQFDSANDAARAYNEAAKEMFGVFAKFNILK